MEADGGLVPILIRMMDARVGSTALMQLFSTAPEVAMDRKHRYENSYLTYLVALMGQISNFQDKSTDLSIFAMDDVVYGQDSRIGPLPFEPMTVDAGTFAQQGLRALWQRFSDLSKERSPGVTHYAEKFWGDARAAIDAGLQPILIDLVRDPRDLVASNRAFSDLMGGKIFGRDQVADERTYVRHLATQIRFRLNEMAAPVSTPKIMIRYEDLIREPKATRLRVEEITGVRLRPELIGALSSEAREHITAGSVDESIGRWRHDLDAAEVREIERRLGPWMRDVGYEVGTS